MNDKDKPVKLDLYDELDLHHFHPADTKDIVLEFIKIAVEKRLKQIRIVHGKGKSVKKFQVYKLLDAHPDVESYSEDGYNWGAVIVVLNLH